MSKIITFGELMLRLSTQSNKRFSDSSSFDACFGGGEANVAVGLASFNNDVSFVTSLPNNQIGEYALLELRKRNVKTNFINKTGDRIGIYFLESGSSLRPSNVIYDRAFSSFYNSKISDFNFDEILKGADWFHFSGITPALNDGIADLCLYALKKAKEYGLTVSCDLNFRKKLWTSEKAISVMRPLMEYVDICIGNEEDSEKCLGYKTNSNILEGKTDSIMYHEVMSKLLKDFNFKYVAFTLRESFSASHNGWKAILYDGNTFYDSDYYDINPIIDRVGSGDSFSAGLIHGLIHYNDLQKALNFAVANSALKHTISGDFNNVTECEVLKLVEGDKSGRVDR